MKKLLLSVSLFAVLGLTANAQNSPIKIGVKAGVAFPNVAVSGDGTDEAYKVNTSFYVGGLVDISLGKILSVQPGLTLIGKGAKNETNVTLGSNSYNDKYNVSLMYLEIPVNLVANFELGAGKIFVGAGPYYSLAISGKNKHSSTSIISGVTSSESESESVKFGSSEESDFKRGDFGLNLLGGYQLKNGFNVHAGYGLGLSNISSYQEDNYKMKNKVLTLGVGFTF